MSIDVDDISLATLKTLNAPQFGNAIFRRFHREHWGVANGAEVTLEDGRHTFCLKTQLGTSHEGPILVRQCYVGLWEHLRVRYLDLKPPSVPPYNATIVYGHPGIGKSVALLYLMCAAAEAKIPFVYHRTGQKGALVCLDAGQFAVPYYAIASLVFTRTALVLIDSVNLEEPSVDVWSTASAHVVLASSPDARRYATVAKERRAVFYTLSLVPRTEFKSMLDLSRTSSPIAQHRPASLTALTCADLAVKDDDSDAMDDDGDVDTYIVRDGKMIWNPMVVFDLLGPNVRVALTEVAWIRGDPLELIDKRSWSVVLESVEVSKVLGLTFRPSTNSKIAFHSNFFEQPFATGPLSNRPPSNLVVPTPFLQRLVLDAVCKVRQTQPRDMLAQVPYHSAFYGAIYEAAVIDHISAVPFRAILPSCAPLRICPRSSRPAFIVYEDTNEPFSTALKAKPVQLDGEIYDKPPCLPDRPGLYVCPPGFASASAIILADGVGADPERYEIIIQATVSKKHTVKARGISTITQALDRHDHSRKRTRLYLFVSDDIDKSARLMDRTVSGWTVGSVTLSESDFMTAMSS